MRIKPNNWALSEHAKFRCKYKVSISVRINMAHWRHGGLSSINQLSLHNSTSRQLALLNVIALHKDSPPSSSLSQPPQWPILVPVEEIEINLLSWIVGQRSEKETKSRILMACIAGWPICLPELVVVFQLERVVYMDGKSVGNTVVLGSFIKFSNIN